MLVNLSPSFQMVSKMASGYKKVRISKDFNGYCVQVLPVNYHTKPFVSGYNLKSYKSSLIRWNNETSTMDKECQALGPNTCLKVFYEQLVRER